jgi:hypothetical protein
LKAQSKNALAFSNLRLQVIAKYKRELKTNVDGLCLQLMGTLEQLQLIFEVPDTIAEVEELMAEATPHWLLIHKRQALFDCKILPRCPMSIVLRRVAELDGCRQHVLSQVDGSAVASASAKKAVISYFADVTRLWVRMVRPHSAYF